MPLTKILKKSFVLRLINDKLAKNNTITLTIYKPSLPMLLTIIQDKAENIIPEPDLILANLIALSILNEKSTIVFVFMSTIIKNKISNT